MFKRLINFILPVECAGCGRKIDTDDLRGICEDCLDKIEILDRECCNYCGRPIKEGQKFCRKCWEFSSFTDSFSSVCYYKEPVKSIIGNFKYKNKRYLKGILTELLEKKYFQIKNIEVDIIVPVPLHPEKLNERGYNQVRLIAENLSKKINIPVKNSIVKRVKMTSPQYRLTRKERLKNLKDAFKAARKLNGKKVLLLDDVATTGSTVQNCAAVLSRAGAGSVHALVAAHGK
ncbi:MAG: ComF family protein [Elusimicrobiota bacterium]